MVGYITLICQRENGLPRYEISVVLWKIPCKNMGLVNLTEPESLSPSLSVSVGPSSILYNSSHIFGMFAGFDRSLGPCRKRKQCDTVAEA